MGDSNNDKGHAAAEADDVKNKKAISMHADIPVWYDCCSCEAEPYWVEAMESALPDEDKRKE